MSYRDRFLRFAALLAGLAVVGCSDDGKECGTGTVEVDGACVPAEQVCADDTTFNTETRRCEGTATMVECGPGTVLEGETCVPDPNAIDCGAGTRAYEGECVVDGSVVCTGATEFDADSGTCVPNDEVCEGGTVFVMATGTCVDPESLLEDEAEYSELAEPNDPRFAEDGMPQMIELGDGTSVYGCLNPDDFDDDGVTDGDTDYFVFQTTDPTVLNAQVDGIGGGTPSLTVISLDDRLEGWQRIALDLSSDDASGKFFLPVGGTYAIAVRDGRELLFGEPAGGPDNCYFAQLSTEDLPAASPVAVGTPETGVVGDPVVYEFTAAEKEIYFFGLELSSNDAPVNAGTFQAGVVVLNNGEFVSHGDTSSGPYSDSVFGPDADDTITLVIEQSLSIVFDDVDFSLDVSSPGAQALPTDGSSVTVSHHPTNFRWLHFDGTAGDVVRIQMEQAADPAATIAETAVIGPDGSGFLYCGSDCTEGDEYFQLTETGTYYFRLYNDTLGNDEMNAGETYDVEFTVTNITPTALTRGTAESVDLSTNEHAFFTVDLSTAEWVEYAVANLVNADDIDVEVYPAATFGILGAAPVASTASLELSATENAERIYGAMGPNALIQVTDADGAAGDETFDFVINDISFTDLGSITSAMPIERMTETLAADGLNRYIVRSAALGETITVSVAGMDPVDAQLQFLDPTDAAVNFTFNDTAAGGVEEGEALVFGDSFVLPFAVSDVAMMGGDYDLTLTSAPPPYSITADSGLMFSSICPDNGGMGEVHALSSADDGRSSMPLDISAVGFEFFGTAQDTLTIVSNGYAGFGPGPFSTSAGLNASTIPRNTISPGYYDLVMNDVCTLIDGDQVIVEWSGRSWRTVGGNNDDVDMQLILNGTTGEIHMLYSADWDTSITNITPVVQITSDERVQIAHEPAIVAGTSLTFVPAAP